jgi:nitrogen fixation/metabolism regulation signal transduction histidine kinase
MTYLTDILPQKKVEISSLLKYFVGNCLTTKNYIVELEIEDDVEGKYCLLDERIHKAFDNILSNAERHAFTANNPQRNYRLKVHAKCEDDIITVLFANNGTPPDPTLTEEGYFTRGLHVGKTGHSGFGGSIIREAIEAQNGIVHLYLNKDKEYPFIIEIKLPAYYD